MSPDAIRGELEQAVEAAGIALDRQIGDRLAAYLERLQAWNRSFNLTAIRNVRDLIQGPLIEALCVRACLPDGSTLDLGTGGGLPGMPIAITEPARSCILMDASAKKVRFLRHVQARLGLSNVEVVHGRAEHTEPLEVNVVVAKAVADLRELLPLAARHCSAGGRVAAIKGPRAASEIACLPPEIAGRTRCIDVPGLTRGTVLVFYDPPFEEPGPGTHERPRSQP